MGAKDRYSALEKRRQYFLDMAKKCADRTLPYLLVESEGADSPSVNHPRQSIGASGVSNLASKLLMTLLPPNTINFRLVLDEYKADQAAVDKDFRTKLEEALAKIEKAVQTSIEGSMDRVTVGEAMKHLLVAGNGLLYDSPEGMRFFPLTKYVVRRNPVGNPVEIIVKEGALPSDLPEEYWSLPTVEKPTAENSTQPIALYTWVRKEEGKWIVSQEIGDNVIPGSEGTYPEDKLPWIPIRFNRLEGFDYGTPYVYDLLGDLENAEDLSAAIVDGALASARTLIFVSPSGTTRKKDVADAPNGGVVTGDAADVTAFQFNKAADLQVAQATLIGIERRLDKAFLKTASVQRDAERVTAEEIRAMAGELEDSLGGLYSILTQEFSLPYVRVKLWRLHKSGSIPALPDSIVSPAIVTGLDALGRNHDRLRLKELLSSIAEIFGPEAVNLFLSVDNTIKQLATSIGVDVEEILKSEEERLQEQQQAQAMQAMGALGPNLINAGAKMMTDIPQQGGTPVE